MAVDARRVLVVEDEQFLASLVADALCAAGFDAKCAHDVEAARALIDTFDPDMVVLDISLGSGPTGVHLAHALDVSRPDIAILFLTRYPDAESASADGLSIPAGAGFLRKHMVNDTQHLLDAIERVFSNRAGEVRHDRDAARGLTTLSPQALTVLHHVAEGCSNSEIARRTGLSVKSVERWIDTAYRQLGIVKNADVNARVEAVKRYYREVGVPQAASP